MIDKLIDQIIDGETTDAGSTVNDILAQKVNDVIELKKMEVAQQIYGKPDDVDTETSAEIDTEESQIEEPDENTTTAEE